jgi:hypothetical protein
MASFIGEEKGSIQSKPQVFSKHYQIKSLLQVTIKLYHIMVC